MEIDFINNNHKKTERNYLARVNSINKAEAAIKAKKWDFDYWDGSRDINYVKYLMILLNQIRLFHMVNGWNYLRSKNLRSLF